jgi:hypothetical protein
MMIKPIQTPEQIAAYHAAHRILVEIHAVAMDKACRGTRHSRRIDRIVEIITWELARQQPVAAALEAAEMLANSRNR